MILEFDGVGKRYPSIAGDGQELTALSRFDLAVAPGEFITLVGPSGCGKSTLLNIAGALLAPSEGTVRYRGNPLVAPRQEIGVMFQTPVLLPWRTVEGNVLLPAEIHGISRDSMRDRVAQVLAEVGLNGYAQAYPRQLSGGMQQRVSLSRVLAYEPDVLLMDEPFGALDEFTRERMNLQLLKLTQAKNITTLFVTHNIPEAIFLADRVVVMNTGPGRIAEVINVPFERPREISMMRSPEFTELTFRVRGLLGVV